MRRRWLDEVLGVWLDITLGVAGVLYDIARCAMIGHDGRWRQASTCLVCACVRCGKTISVVPRAGG